MENIMKKAHFAFVLLLATLLRIRLGVHGMTRNNTLLRSKLLLTLAISACVLAVAGCQNGNDAMQTATAPAKLLIDPIISQYSDTSNHIEENTTFTLFPYSAYSENHRYAFGNEIVERQMLLQVRNAMEVRGYKYVDYPQNADIIVTISGSCSYDTSYIPPSTRTVPVYVPPSTSTSNTYSYGTANAYGTGGSDYGTYSGNSTTSTTTPGHLDTQTYVSPGYTFGHYYPFVDVDVFSNKGAKLTDLWNAKGTGTSDTSDIRVCGQLLLLKMFEKMPTCRSSNSSAPLGIDFLPFTTDGNNIYPLVQQVASNSPGDKIGVHRADLILKINGTETVNRPYSEVLSMIENAPPTNLTIDVKRGDKEQVLSSGKK
jgi:hypothetical protein